jgi:hypothetical protein
MVAMEAPLKCSVCCPKSVSAEMEGRGIMDLDLYHRNAPFIRL